MTQIKKNIRRGVSVMRAVGGLLFIVLGLLTLSVRSVWRSSSDNETSLDTFVKMVGPHSVYADAPSGDGSSCTTSCTTDYSMCGVSS